ncbi:MAG: hypothetical protein CM15mP128_0060 [Methanobacteriota archaeon]|nr:MAG: hypothetical protein CM15mP128_0060 [Euryarchaeota archaeon]
MLGLAGCSAFPRHHRGWLGRDGPIWPSSGAKRPHRPPDCEGSCLASGILNDNPRVFALPGLAFAAGGLPPIWGVEGGFHRRGPLSRFPKPQRRRGGGLGLQKGCRTRREPPGARSPLQSLLKSPSRAAALPAQAPLRPGSGVIHHPNRGGRNSPPPCLDPGGLPAPQRPDRRARRAFPGFGRPFLFICIGLPGFLGPHFFPPSAGTKPQNHLRFSSSGAAAPFPWPSVGGVPHAGPFGGFHSDDDVHDPFFWGPVGIGGLACRTFWRKGRVPISTNPNHPSPIYHVEGTSRRIHGIFAALLEDDSLEK